MPAMLTPDKRAHYRLADHIQVRYKHVSQDETKNDDAAGFFSTGESTGETLSILKELYRLDLEARETVRRMLANDRDMANFLGNLNRRVTLLGQAMRASEGDAASFDAPVRLSEGGISFLADELLDTGAHLALKLSFRDSLLALATFAEVRHCRLADDGECYVIGTRFVSLGPSDQELIQRYIIHRQAEERRARLRV
ncbi:MAG: PilZ domain-containing protein [Gammaproteobacteria bacterium]|nr:PilZ domain-containing protein [Gammaproteobacteria bacterium]